MNVELHHPALRFDIIENKCDIKQSIVYFRDFKTANYDVILSNLDETDWISIIIDFYDVIFRIVNEFVP